MDSQSTISVWALSFDGSSEASYRFAGWRIGFSDILLTKYMECEKNRCSLTGKWPLDSLGKLLLEKICGRMLYAVCMYDRKG
jgi:hypothetical protein